MSTIRPSDEKRVLRYQSVVPGSSITPTLMAGAILKFFCADLESVDLVASRSRFFGRPLEERPTEPKLKLGYPAGGEPHPSNDGILELRRDEAYSGKAYWPSMWKPPLTPGAPVSGCPPPMLME